LLDVGYRSASAIEQNQLDATDPERKSLGSILHGIAGPLFIS
jgi:hypothetical protein